MAVPEISVLESESRPSLESVERSFEVKGVRVPIEKQGLLDLFLRCSSVTVFPLTF